jgi:hypothetical protein
MTTKSEENIMSKFQLCVDEQGRKERSLYEDAEGRKYLRVRENDQNSMVTLGTTSLSKAVKIRDERRAVKVAVKLGMPIASPTDAAKKSKTTVAKVIKAYRDAGFPGKRGGARPPGRHRDEEAARCETLLEYFNGTAAAEDLDQDGLDHFHDWICAEVAKGVLKKDGTRGKVKGNGHRATDLDLNCLNNAYRWGLRKKMIKTNPIEKRVKYTVPGQVVHCREFCPESALELHSVAGVMMSSRRSEAVGWQLLIEGMTALRCDEAVQLRVDARANEAGGRTPDGKNLCVRRALKSKKFNCNVKVHEGLDMVLAAHRIWHEARYPISPWYIPGRTKKVGEPEEIEGEPAGENGEAPAEATVALKHAYKGALTKSLDRLFKTGKLPRKYTSHGAGRAFYVYARRCQGASDTEIAYEINHTGGVGTLEQVYGLPAKHWQNGDAPGMDWLPKDPKDYAWNKIKGVDFSALDKAKAEVGDFSI